MDTRFKQKYFINEDFFNSISYKQAYYLGLIASDGCIINDRAVTLSQSGENGLFLLKQIKDMLDWTGNFYKSKNAYAMYYSSKKVVHFLNDYGIYERKTYNIEYPKKLPEELFLYFLRGYFDGDGCLGYYNNGAGQYCFVMTFVGTENFINEINRLLPIKGKIKKIERCKNLFEFRVYGEPAKNLYKLLYESTYNNVPIISAKQLKYKSISFKENFYMKYKDIRNIFFEKYNNGEKIMDISRELKFPFQTLYAWLKQHKEQINK